MILGTWIISSLILKCLSKTFVLVPYNSIQCHNNSLNIYNFYEFTIIQQINLNTNSNASEVLKNLNSFENVSKNNLDSDNSKYYLCRTLVKPMGRQSVIHDIYGVYSFWNLRVMIDRSVGHNNCNDYLLLQFRHQFNLITTLDGHSANVTNITCKTPLPITIPSDLRKLYITYFSSDSSSAGFVINVTSFIQFKGKFAPRYQQDLCRRYDGFWCVNVSMCVYRDMNCDGYDSCFDGGSDEVGCANISDLTTQTYHDKRRNNSSGFIDYLPWIALGILPLVLLLALICICNQHRSEVYFDDDEEDNLDFEKSNEGEDRCSSIDCIDRINDDTMEEVDWCGEGQCCDSADVGDVNESGLGLVSLGLLPLNKSTKADMSTDYNQDNIGHIADAVSPTCWTGQSCTVIDSECHQMDTVLINSDIDNDNTVLEDSLA